jgi:two-component system, NarL family, nitrate/nitrite response regulator NarL
MSATEKDERIKIVFLDHHLLLRESLARLLASERDFKVVAQSADIADALKVLKTSAVDVVLVDLSLARELMQGAAGQQFRGKFLVMSRGADPLDSAAVLKEGASGIFLESDSSSRLFQAIRLVSKGEAWVDHQVLRLLADRYPQYDVRLLGKLTNREQSVLEGVVAGLSNRKIGDQLGVSESSVKATLQQLFTKSGVRTRSQLVRIALEGTYAHSPGAL